MDYDQLELQRESIFKDAVLTGADLKARRIVERAEIDAQRKLQDAQAACEEADEEKISAQCRRDSERQFGALAHEARRELLAYRAELVDEMFREVEKRLAAFTRDELYSAWMQSRMEANRGFIAAAGESVVYLRAEDMALAEELCNFMPECKAEAREDIRLGGLMIGDGKRLLDETLDARLADERENFYAQSGLRV